MQFNRALHQPDPTFCPKSIKEGMPGRPVISACGSATEGLSEIGDQFLQPYLPNIPSYVHDTDQFIRKMRDFDSVLPVALLVTKDVVALYVSISHHDGLSALCEFLSERHLPTEVIMWYTGYGGDRAERKCVSLEFGTFLQTSGTAIGTKIAPAHAYIFMCILERALLESASDQPELWLRFIDIFTMGPHGEDKLKEFIALINSFNSNVQFTYEYSSGCDHKNRYLLSNRRTRTNTCFRQVATQFILSGVIYLQPIATHRPDLLQPLNRPLRLRRTDGVLGTTRVQQEDGKKPNRTCYYQLHRPATCVGTRLHTPPVLHGTVSLWSAQVF